MTDFHTFPSPDLSPVSLSYVAALRGVLPRSPGTGFAYAAINAYEPLALICLAASNPEGKFFGIMENKELAENAGRLARERQTENVEFHTGPVSEIPLPGLDYLVWDETRKELCPEEREQLFTLVEKTLKPGGLLAASYRAYSNPDEALCFLAKEFGPEMNSDESREFLQEIRVLGKLYFSGHPIARKALESAIESGKTEEFFAACDTGTEPRSGTLDFMTDLMPRGFAFVGDADVRFNYMDLVAPPEAHETLEKCRDHLLYEPIKDFTAGRLFRNDIWCHLPADQTSDPVRLFGEFTYGIFTSQEEIPETVKTMRGIVDLRQPLLKKIITLMSDLPMSIGDFLHHPLGIGADPDEVLTSIQLLVALGLAKPMRGRHLSQGKIHLSQLKWANDYNRYLNSHSINTPQVLLASQVVGGAVRVPARDALVMQAINRAGFVNSAGALLLELERIAKEPAIAAKIMDVAEPTETMAENITQDVIRRSMIRWYAYGLLAA